jgi:mannitol-1-phosphate 5-dehydrogenase
VASSLKKKLRPSCRIIVCENAADPARILKNALGRDDIAVAESTVFCTTVEGEGLSIVSETYPYLQYNSDAFGKPVVPYPGFKPIPSFGNFLVRKIFTYNNASAVIAYLGALKGYQAYSEAANDPEILRLLDENYLATNEAMCRVYGYEKKDQEEFAALSKAKFTDPSIKDSIERNARDPLRKMGKEERIVGPLLLLWKEGLDSSVLEKTLAALLLYSDPKDLVWSKAQKEKSPADLLRLYSSLDPSETKVQRVLAYVQDPKSILAH